MGHTSLAAKRWFVHLGLIVTTVVSLVFEFVLTVHVVIGLLFIAFVAAHLLQRRRATIALARRLPRVATWARRASRMALADTTLLVLTLAMLLSGFVDVGLGHPTRIRWHAISGVVLTVLLVVHTLRRRHRLTSSAIR